MRQFFICLSFAVLLFSCQKPRQEVIKTSYYHQYGPAVSVEEWKKQGSTGIVSRLKSDGVEERRSYVDGVLQGTSTWSFPHSKIVESSEEYVQGNKIGLGHNFPSGSPEREDEFLSPNDQMIRRWYEDGSPLSLEHLILGKFFEGQYYNDDGVLESAIMNGNGVRIARSPQGVLLAREQLLNGESIAKEIFHSNGVVQEVCSYSNGKKDGVRKCFDEAGRPVLIETYKADLLNGSALYFREGMKVSSIPYSNGIKEGTEQHFHPDSGAVIEEIIWIQGDRHGPATVCIDGTTAVGWYWRGVLVTEAQFMKNDETVRGSKKS